MSKRALPESTLEVDDGLGVEVEDTGTDVPCLELSAPEYQPPQPSEKAKKSKLPAIEWVDYNRYAQYITYLEQNVIGIVDKGHGGSTVNKKIEAQFAKAIGSCVYQKYFRWGNGTIMAFTGVKYSPLTKEEIENMARATMEIHGVAELYQINSCAPIRKHLERLLQSKPYNPQRNYVSFTNGLLDLDTGVLHDHDERFETDIYLDFEYDKNAKCDRWKTFLTEVLDDADTIKVAQEFCGAIFMDREQYKFENALFLVGTGQNGKGVFGETIRAVLGRENATSYSVEQIFNGNSAYNIAAINGKLANICSDMSKADISGGDFKRLISGEPIPARNPYGRAFEATRIPLMIASVNEFFQTSDHTEGHSRRVNLSLPFNVTIPKEKKDIQLSAKLRAEFSGIFNWIYEGRRRLIAQHGIFTESKKIVELAAKIKTESNSVLLFMSESQYESTEPIGFISEKKIMSTADLYQKYQEYCKANGLAPFSLRNMTKLLGYSNYVMTRYGTGKHITLYIVNRDVDSTVTSTEEDDPLNSLPF